ncbi:MAG: hypothetical protein QNJ90_10430 [Planctomycetota bacterium]|nr:hypothetical protein [Planctomycetota bacterium]
MHATWTRLTAAALLLGALLPCVLRPGVAVASSEARTAAEIYERRPHLKDCIEYIARELKARWEADKQQDSAELVLVIDPTTTMKDEIETLRAALKGIWRVGPPGLRIGVHGIQADVWQPPNRVPSEADGNLASLAFLPVDGPKNILAGVRAAAENFAETGTGPKALVLVSQEFDGGEDDVERTREAIFDSGAAFYCIAGEAGFQRAWLQEFEARDFPSFDLTERYNPQPRKKTRNALYYGGEVAFGLMPYRWEFDLAQSDFVWVRPPRYPVPSGFGYWCLATLCYTSGGRYFIYDFTLPASHPQRLEPRDPKKRKSWRERRRRTTYDFSRLSILAPDLRPRARVLKSLNKDWRAETIVRVWEHLANDAVPVVQRIGTLERRGTTLVPRPERPVRSETTPLTWFEDMDDVKKAMSFIRERLGAVETALKWWESANGRERTEKPGEDALKERIEADFQLLGVQLRKVRFHHNEALAVLKSIKPLDVTYRRARILPQPISYGTAMPRKKVDLMDDERNARWAEVFLAQSRVARKYPGTPWSHVLQKGWMMTFRKDVQILEQEPERRRPRPDPSAGKGGKGKKKPTPPPAPKPPPPPGPRPGSGSAGPVTGK